MRKQKQIFRLKGILLSGFCGALFVIPHIVFAVDARASDLHLYELRKNRTAHQQNTLPLFDDETLHGGSIALGNVDRDGDIEIVVGAGHGEQPDVTIFSSSGVMEYAFRAYAEGFLGGVSVAVGDLDGDGVDDIVTGSGHGGGPQVRVFDAEGTSMFTNGFFAYDAAFGGGVNVTIGNIDGKGLPEIITGAGPGGGPHVRVFNRFGQVKGAGFMVFDTSVKGGVTVSAGNIDGDEDDEIVVGVQSFGEPRVRVIKGTTGAVLTDFLAYDSNMKAGVHLATADVRQNDHALIVTAPRHSASPHVRFFNAKGKAVGDNFFAYEEDFRGGVALAVGNVDRDAKPELLTLPTVRVMQGRMDLYKYIDVDLSEQTLRAYRNGVKEREFLVSTGIAKYPTPEGDFSVLAKIPMKDYEWSYGENNPDNYNLPDVANNLRFTSHYYIHYAYWHNNFGHRMSHGCVNVNEENSAWIYEWASVGDPVIIHE